MFSYFIIAGIYLDQIIELINFNTSNLHREDGNFSFIFLEKNFFSLFIFLSEFLRQVITLELLKNTGSLIFYLEILFFLFLIIFFLMKNFSENKSNFKICFFWILNMFFVLNMYSTVVSNVFTLFRYMMVIFISTVIILYMETKKIKTKN